MQFNHSIRIDVTVYLLSRIKHSFHCFQTYIKLVVWSKVNASLYTKK